jgi:hypothetical protein
MNAFAWRRSSSFPALEATRENEGMLYVHPEGRNNYGL